MCDAPLPHSRRRRPRRPVALLLANYAVGGPAPLAAVLWALILLGSAWGTTPQSPAVTAPLQGSQSCGQALRQITSCHLPQSPGTVKTVPYRAFYCVRPTHKHPAGGGPDSAGNLPEQIQKTCDVLCPTVGDGVLDVPDGHINDCTFAGNLPPQKIARTT